MSERERPRLLAIDPGSEFTGWILLELRSALELPVPLEHGKDPNPEVLTMLRRGDQDPDQVVLEWMSPRGMPTSAQEFETMFWAGRFAEAAEVEGALVGRLVRDEAKRILTGKRNAKDPNVRAALIDLYGGIRGKAGAVGVKKDPGPLYGIAADVWAALAVGVAWTQREARSV